MTSHSCWKLYLCIVWKQKIQLILTLGLHNVAVPWSQRAPPLTTSDLPVVTPTAAKISSLLSSQLKRNPGWTSVLGHNASTSTKVRLNTTTIGILLQAAISLRARKRGGSRLRRTCAHYELRYCNLMHAQEGMDSRRDYPAGDTFYF